LPLEVMLIYLIKYF